MVTSRISVFELCESLVLLENRHLWRKTCSKIVMYIYIYMCVCARVCVYVYIYNMSLYKFGEVVFYILLLVSVNLK